MKYIKTIKVVVCYCIILTTACPSVKTTAEAVTVGLLATDTKIYEGITGKSLRSWKELATLYDDPKLSRINIKLSSGETFTEVYSIIPPTEGDKFPEGLLMYVRYKPLEWPSIWSEDSDDNDPRAHPIRYLVYKDKKGGIKSEWWYEEKFRSMLAETGLTIPPPTPYYPQASTPPLEKPADRSAPVAPVVATQTAPVVVPAATPTPTTAPVALPPANLANPLWWIVGAIAALAAVVFVARRKKPKA